MPDTLVLVILIILLILTLGFLLMKKVKKSKGGYNHIIEFDKESVKILNAFLSKLHKIEELPDKPPSEVMKNIRLRLDAFAPVEKPWKDRFIDNGDKFMDQTKTPNSFHRLGESIPEEYWSNLLYALDGSVRKLQLLSDEEKTRNYWLDGKRSERPRIDKVRQILNLEHLEPSRFLPEYFSGEDGYQILNKRVNFINVRPLEVEQKDILKKAFKKTGKHLCDESFQVEYGAHRDWEWFSLEEFSYKQDEQFEELNGKIFSWKHSVHLYRGVPSNNVDMTVFLQGFYQVPFQELTVGKEYTDPNHGTSLGNGLYTTGNFEIICKYTQHVIYGYEIRYNRYCYNNIAYILDEKYMAAITHDYAPEFIHRMSREAVDLWCCRAYENPRPYLGDDDDYDERTQASILTYVGKRKDLASFPTLEEKIEELWRRLESQFSGIRTNARFEPNAGEYMEWCRGFDLVVSFTNGFDDDNFVIGKPIEALKSDITEIPNYEVMTPRGQGVLLREVLLFD